jgi:hypothetical protein
LVFLKKIKKIENFFFGGAPDAPEDQAICLFAGLLANPDMALSTPDCPRTNTDFVQKSGQFMFMRGLPFS